MTLTPRKRLSALVFLGCLSVSCSDRQVVPTGGGAAMEGSRQYAVTADPGASGIDLTRHVPGSLRVVEEDLVSRILDSVPEADRNAVAAALADPGTFITHVDGHPEVARLLSRLYAIRSADQEAVRRERIREAVRHRTADAIVALDSTALRDGEDAVILRSTSLPPLNIIAMRPARASAILLGRAVSILMASRETTGDAPLQPLRIPVAEGASPHVSLGQEGRLTTLLARLRPMDVEGLGHVMATRIRLKPPREVRDQPR